MKKTTKLNEFDQRAVKNLDDMREVKTHYDKAIKILEDILTARSKNNSNENK